MRGSVFWFLLLLCGSAAAQTMSETELQAGYCLGVSTSQAEIKIAELKEEANDPILRTYDQDILRQIHERQKRFEDYLSAKGFNEGSKPSSIENASERGRKDLATCKAELEHRFYKECPERCDRLYGENTDAMVDCFNRCPNPNSCNRVSKCVENFLPF